MGPELNHPMNTFHWLIILGFPPSVAAATVAPEIFTDAETPSSGAQQSPCA